MKNIRNGAIAIFFIPLLTVIGNAQSIDLISRSSDNKSFGTFYDSSAPVIGGRGADDGRYVAFVSSAAGLGDSKGKHRQIIWRDRKSGNTRLISAGDDGEGDADSFAPSISADGLSVAFESYATNLAPIDTNDVRDIFVWNAKTNVITAASTGAGETETNAESFEASVSGDGTLVAFSSGASNLALGVEGTNTINVYLKKVGSGAAPLLISADPKTKKGVGGSKPAISNDGTRVAFYSFSSKLVSGDENDLWDIFLFDKNSPKLRRISLTSTGVERDQGSESSSRVVAPAISGNGRVVAFATTAANMIPSDNNNFQDIFAVDISGGELTWASSGSEGDAGNADSPSGQGESAALSFDGNWITFNTSATNLGGDIIARNIKTNETKIISRPGRGGVSRPAISPDGGYIVFGAGDKLDKKYASTGIFVACSGIAYCSH